MRFVLTVSLLACSIASATMSPARAGIIYDSGVPPALVVNAGTADSGTFSIADGSSFTLGSTSIINEVQWSGIYDSGYSFQPPPATDDFTIQFFDFSSVTPDDSPLFSYSVGNAVNRTETGLKLSLFGLPSVNIYTFNAAIPNTSLAAGRYLVSIVDDTSRAGFSWSDGPSGVGSLWGHFTDSPISPWIEGNSGITNAFTLLGSSSVPEPSGLILFGSAITGVVAMSLRRRKSQKMKARRADHATKLVLS
jgi:PEP-CTERM motif